MMADAHARTGGVQDGMALANARAILPTLETQPAEPDKDARTLHALANWCVRYTPWTNVDTGDDPDRHDGLWLDITGAAHLVGGEEALLRDLGDRLDTMGFENRLGLAETPGAAWAIARFSRASPAAWQNRIIAPGEVADTLSPLPVEALRLEPQASALLNRLGLKTIGQLTGLPRPSVARRFPSRQTGDAVLTRLDQALGDHAEPVSPLTPAPAYRSRARFAEPILATESFEATLDRLLDDLKTLLEKDGVGARRLTYAAYRTDGGVSPVSIGMARPTRNPEHLKKLFAGKLETIDPGYGVDMVILNADIAEPLDDAQAGFAGADAAPQDGPAFDELIDRLSNRLGTGAVRRTMPRESHIPERAEQSVPAGTPAEKSPASWSQVGLPARPLRLLERPEPIDAVAEIPDGPPMMFRWRRVLRRVVHAQGPERIFPEWWHDLGEREQVRDYYDVEDAQGHRYWIFREGLYQDPGAKGPPVWRLHGLFA